MLCVMSLRLGEHFYFLSVQNSVLGTGTTCFVSVQGGVALLGENRINEPGIGL